MKQCDVIQEILVSSQTLTPEQQAHLEGCRDCATFRATIEEVVASRAPVRVLSEPSVDEIRAMQETVARKTRPPRAGWRLAWASAAMVLGILLAIAILSDTFGTDNLEQSEERLIALLDEVAEIADPYEESSTEIIGDGGLYLAEVLLEDSSAVDTELQLPESYQLLEQALENDWL
jgi:hypothetical protein